MTARVYSAVVVIADGSRAQEDLAEAEAEIARKYFGVTLHHVGKVGGQASRTYLVTGRSGDCGRVG